MPKTPKTMMQGSPITAAMLNELLQRMVQSIIGGYDINVTRSGNNIVISRATNQIIPSGGAATNFGSDISYVSDTPHAGSSNLVPREDHIHGITRQGIHLGHGICMYTAVNETARDALLSYGYPIPSSDLYARTGDFCHQTDNNHIYRCRDTGSEFVWDDDTHWAVGS